MIYVRVEMWPKGSVADRRVLGEALVENVGGSRSRGDYRAWFSKRGGFKADSLEQVARFDVKNVWRKASLQGYARKSRVFWHLLFEVVDAVRDRGA